MLKRLQIIFKILFFISIFLTSSKAEILKPNNAVLLNNLAKTYMCVEQVSKAENYCRKAISLDEKNNEFQKTLSLILLKKYDFENSLSFLWGTIAGPSHLWCFQFSSPCILIRWWVAPLELIVLYSYNFSLIIFMFRRMKLGWRLRYCYAYLFNKFLITVIVYEKYLIISVGEVLVFKFFILKKWCHQRF